MYDSWISHFFHHHFIKFTFRRRFETHTHTKSYAHFQQKSLWLLPTGYSTHTHTHYLNLYEHFSFKLNFDRHFPAKKKTELSRFCVSPMQSKQTIIQTNKHIQEQNASQPTNLLMNLINFHTQRIIIIISTTFFIYQNWKFINCVYPGNSILSIWSNCFFRFVFLFLLFFSGNLLGENIYLPIEKTKRVKNYIFQQKK